MSLYEDRGVIGDIGRNIGRDRPPSWIVEWWPPALAVTELQPDEDKVDSGGMITAAQAIGCFFLLFFGPFGPENEHTLWDIDDLILRMPSNSDLEWPCPTCFRRGQLIMGVATASVCHAARKVRSVDSNFCILVCNGVMRNLCHRVCRVSLGGEEEEDAAKSSSWVEASWR
jgi:hypothetical protein